MQLKTDKTLVMVNIESSTPALWPWKMLGQVRLFYELRKILVLLLN